MLQDVLYTTACGLSKHRSDMSAMGQLKQEEEGDRERSLGELGTGVLWQCRTQQKQGKRQGARRGG